MNLIDTFFSKFCVYVEEGRLRLSNRFVRIFNMIVYTDGAIATPCRTMFIILCSW